MSDLYYNTTLSERFNGRMLAMRNMKPEDNDVFPLVSEVPETNPRFEMYKDSGNVIQDGGVFKIVYDVVDLPQERVVENVYPDYVEELERKRTSNILLDGMEVFSPHDMLPVFKSWKSGVDNNWGTTPTPPPFVGGVPDGFDTARLATMITELEDHLTKCDTVKEGIRAHLEGSTVADLRSEDPAVYIESMYSAL